MACRHRHRVGGLWLEGRSGWPVDAVVIAAVVLLNGGLGFLQEAKAIPVNETEGEVVLAMTDPADDFTVRAMAAATQKHIVPRLLSTNDFETVYEKLYGSGKSSMGQIVDDIATRDDEQDFGGLG